jgi:hypothetical protein
MHHVYIIEASAETGNYVFGGQREFVLLHEKR